MSTKRDYYETLGVAKDAGTEEIERAFRKLARQHHPDRNIGDKEAEGRFKEITEAHAVLVDETKRERYDRYGHAGLEGMNDPGFGQTSSFADIMNDLFGTFMGGQWAARASADRSAAVICGWRWTLRWSKQPRESSATSRFAGMRYVWNVRAPAAKTASGITCNRCKGRGEFIQRQGFFELRQTCPSCGGPAQ